MYLGNPTINITSTNTELFDSLYSLTGTLSNYSSDYSSIQYQVDSGTWQTITNIAGNDFTANLSGVVDNVHTINVRITDCDSNATDTVVLSYPINWIDIPGGTFMMGATHELSYSYAGRSVPLHTVQITDFDMLETEVTIAQYCEYLNAVEQSNSGRYSISSTANMSDDTYCGITRNGTDGSYTYSVMSGWANHPIVYVTWTNSCDFCQYISGTLPSEAQWEYAAGGPNNYDWSLSDTFICTNYCCGSIDTCMTKSSSCEVKAYGTANDYGLWDMSGGVYEWSVDWLSIDGSTSGIPGNVSFYQCVLNGSCSNVDPVNTYESSELRVVRGGSWDTHDDSYFRVSSRYRYFPTYRNSISGFRCVR